jgi:hypothetical protein
VIEWVLILSLELYRGGVAIEQVPGFSTFDECTMAADTWLVYKPGSRDLRAANIG